MRRGTIATILGATTVLGAVVGFLALDVFDLVPGALTISRAVRPADPPAATPQSALPAPAMSAPNAPAISPQDVAAAFDATRAAAEEGKWTTWAYVIDLDSGEVLFDEKGSLAHTPASVTKVLTAHSALAHLNPAARLATGTSLVGQDLYLWGEGDLLLAPGSGDENSTNGHAGLADLAVATAAKMKERGISEAHLHWVPNPFEGPSHLSAWGPQDVAAYEGHVGVMGIDAGRIAGNSMSFVADPAANVADVFAQRLQEQGISVDLAGEKQAPNGGEELARVESATIAQQVRFFLHESDNTIADQYCRLSAKAAGVPSSYEGATGLVISDLAAAGVSTEGLTLDDCSGLSTNNRISGKTLAEAIRASLNSPKPAVRDLARSLPWAGLQGTLTRRMDGEETAANVQAKTGSLAEVATLAGVVTTSGGRTLVFAVGNDKVPNDAAALTRPHLDAFVTALASL